MVREVKIYIEGGGNSKEERVRCREGFRKLIEKSGVAKGHMPRLVACGGRGQAFRDFEVGIQKASVEVLLLVDSEDPPVELTDEVDNDFAWRHLTDRDKWQRPPGAKNHQALLMSTCMETWIAADKEALKEHFGSACMQESALLPSEKLERRSRQDVLKALEHATRGCKKSYHKGILSYLLLTKLTPAALQAQLSQFRRFLAVLQLLALGK